ncbi:unnamed protein product [Phaedon cochleariae]|uniref:VWFA domain-containing protein n=1 Tax=Phaedon cochleariae TaxID=80249 RepID=A0A9P0DS86_PHACE|nr:unnamed protein product [Phaedon cochleariae]
MKLANRTDKNIVIFLLIVVLSGICVGKLNDKKWERKEEVKRLVKMWSTKIGDTLTDLSERMTRDVKMHQSFKVLEEKLVKEDAADLIGDVAWDIKLMMESKEHAVLKIADYAEFTNYHRDPKPIFFNSSYFYYNADNLTNTNWTQEREQEVIDDILTNECHWTCEQPRYTNLTNNMFASYKRREKLLEQRRNERTRACNCEHLPEKDGPPLSYLHLPLKYNPKFGEEVNPLISIAKLAINVYQREQGVLEGLRWSEALDLVFKENHANDSSLTWQYFASPRGFMRHYPAVKWSDEQYDKTYDFRTRTWYTEALTSPKDVIILLDRSGSTKGKRRIVATQIVNQILDTLNDNDFVNIYTFTNTTEPLVQCFNDTLFQANEENLRLLREQLPVYEEEFAADLNLGMEKAFDILENFRTTRRSAKCNQAIMLITEGIDYEYNKELFRIRNWNKDFPVRIFTYQLGHDDNDAKEMEWIACSNMGYWGNMTEMGDIREKMLQYLNVMSRPINMSEKKNRKFIWSYLHVDLADRRLSNWLWKKFEGIRQREVLIDHIKRDFYRQQKNFTSSDHVLLKSTHGYQKYQKEWKFKYMTTVSLPVYDRRHDQYELLGVAGIDVPLHLFKDLIPFERLGVNGYAFIVTNNGFVLFHPDHRPEFQNILKPTFNRVDICEVEILNDENEPRVFNELIVKFRDRLVNQNQSIPVTLNVKYPLNDNKRVMLTNRHYYFAPVGPFTLGVVLPDKYGFDIIDKSKIELPTVESTSYLLASSFWKVHPDWIYCRKCKGATPEDKIRDAFSRNEKSKLLKSLFFDMEVTKWFDDKSGIGNGEKKYISDYQVHQVFMATYSGLTRWRMFEDQESIHEEEVDSFEKWNNKAIDEDWYRRAVELNFENEDMFIYSVPFETSGYENNTMITSTKAIFVSNGELRSPVAVIGLQFNHREMYEIYNEITKECGEKKCRLTCNNKLECYILDNNAYIVLSDEPEFIGRYIGDIRPDILNDLVEDGVFIATRMFDYQGNCQKKPPEKEPEEIRVKKRKEKLAKREKELMRQKKETTASSNASPRLNLILDHLLALKNWIVKIFFLFFGQAMADDTRYYSNKDEMIAFNKLEIVKTVPTPCDTEHYLFNLNQNLSFPFIPFRKGNKFDCSWPYAIEKIPKTNLLFLAANSDEGDACKDRDGGTKYFIEPKEIVYNIPTVENITLPCYIARTNNYTRRMYMDCHNRIKKEDQLNSRSRYYCGHTWD